MGSELKAESYRGEQEWCQGVWVSRASIFRWRTRGLSWHTEQEGHHETRKHAEPADTAVRVNISFPVTHTFVLLVKLSWIPDLNTTTNRAHLHTITPPQHAPPTGGKGNRVSIQLLISTVCTAHIYSVISSPLLYMLVQISSCKTVWHINMTLKKSNPYGSLSSTNDCEHKHVYWHPFYHCQYYLIMKRLTNRFHN